MCSIVILVKNSKFFPTQSEGQLSSMDRLREPRNVNAGRPQNLTWMFHPTDSEGERQCLHRLTAYNAELIKRTIKDVGMALKMLLHYIISI